MAGFGVAAGGAAGATPPGGGANGGGGALGWLNLLGLVALWGVGERQRRSRE